MRAIDQFSIRQQNMEKIWTELQQEGPLSRQRLAEKTSLSLMTVSNVIDQLNRQGVLRAEQAAKPAVLGHRQAGRKAELLSIDDTRFAWLVLDLTSVYFRRSTLALNLTPADGDAIHPYDATQAYAEQLRRFLFQTRAYIDTRLKARTPLGIAVVTPGPYSVQADSIFNRRIPALNEVRIKALLRETLGEWDSFVEEDVKLAVRAYLPSAAQAGVDLLYYLYIGEGVGGAATYHGDVLRGLNAVAGDAGQILAEDGRPFEALVSLRAFAKRLGVPAEALGVLDEDALVGRLAERAAAAPDAYCQALRETAAHVSQMLHTVVWMLDPEQIVVDCRYAAPFEQVFLSAARDGLTASLRSGLPKTPVVTPAHYTIRSVLYGAAQALSAAWFERIV